MALAKKEPRRESEASGAVARVEPMPRLDPEATARQRLGGRNWGSEHPVNIRLSIPLPFRRCYLTIVGGAERRDPERRAAERQRHPLATLGNTVFLVCAGLVIGLAGLAGIQMFLAFVFQETGFVS